MTQTTDRPITPAERLAPAVITAGFTAAAVCFFLSPHWLTGLCAGVALVAQAWDLTAWKRGEVR
jgi:hypothetical protein